MSRGLHNLFYLKGGIYSYVQACVSPIDISHVTDRHWEGDLIFICEILIIVKYSQAHMHCFSIKKASVISKVFFLFYKSPQTPRDM